MSALRSCIPGVVFAILVLGCVSPTRVHQLQWLEARTRHFTIWSALGREQTLELARDLEIFRALVDRTTGTAPVDSAIPTAIFAVPGASAYRAFASSRTVGFFQDDTRGSRMMIRDNAGIDELAILKHEYVHFVLASGQVAYPRWYHEGFAEFLSTAHVEGDRIEIGQPPKWRLKLARHWLPLERVIEPPARMSARSEAMFYTECWALVHYLHFGRGGDREVKADLARYVLETADGTPAPSAVELAFGVPLQQLDRELRSYLYGGSFPYVTGRLEDFAPETEAALEPVAPAAMALELGWLSLAVGRPEQADSYFASARSLDPGSSRALAGQGVAALYGGDAEASRAALEGALAEDPQHPLNHLDYARLLHTLAEAAEDDAARDAFLAEARRHYVASWKLDDGVPETYAMYGASFLLGGQDPSRGIDTLEHAHQLLPSNLEIRLLLARSYAAAGRSSEARDMVSSVLGWSHQPEQREQAEELLARIDGGEPPVAAPR